MLKVNIQRINKTIDYIEQNLNDDLSLNVLAKYANYSPYHFHRMFSNFKGETPHNFVQRKRLEQIAWQLLKRKDQPVERIVLQYGFDNHVSFAKSFKKFYGLSASQLRKQSNSPFSRIIRQKSKIGKERIKVENYFARMENIQEWMSSKGTIHSVQMPGQRLASIRNQGNFELADAAFIQLNKWAKKNQVKEEDRQWRMVIHDNPAITEESKMNHSSCLAIDRVTSVSKEVNLLDIPAGKFLVGTFELSDTEFVKAWGSVSMSLLIEGFQYRDGHYFEVFHSNSILKKNVPHGVDICIPIV